ncbi:MAG: SCO6745 family protein [Ilumatobacteraceae bacterium]
MTSLSSRTTSSRAAADIAGPIGAIGGAFMLHPEVLGPGKEAGYPGGFAYYVVGRGGVLGDVDADVVVSAFGFFAPDLVASLWNAGVTVEGARAGARRYAEACANWGRSRLADFAQAERLADLVKRVVERADVGGLSLFAGWRGVDLPDDPAGRCYVLTHVLRELRGSVHLVACVASGLTPLDAVLANPTGGIEQAEKFGWTGPFSISADLATKFAAAEELTNALMGRHLDVLTDDELTELSELVASAHATIFS